MWKESNKLNVDSMRKHKKNASENVNIRINLIKVGTQYPQIDEHLIYACCYYAGKQT